MRQLGKIDKYRTSRTDAIQHGILSSCFPLRKIEFLIEESKLLEEKDRMIQVDNE
jgi:hypothetical protein